MQMNKMLQFVLLHVAHIKLNRFIAAFSGQFVVGMCTLHKSAHRHLSEASDEGVGKSEEYFPPRPGGNYTRSLSSRLQPQRNQHNKLVSDVYSNCHFTQNYFQIPSRSNSNICGVFFLIFPKTQGLLAEVRLFCGSKIEVLICQESFQYILFSFRLV